MENRKVLKAISYLAIILLAVVARLVPHPANFAPIGGLALFSGTNFNNKFSFLIPMLAMLISDIFLGFHATMPFIYLSFFIIYFIGRNTKINKWQNLLLVSLITIWKIYFCFCFLFL